MSPHFFYVGIAWNLEANCDQGYVVFQAVNDSAGTYMGQSFVPEKALQAPLVGVVAYMVIACKFEQFRKAYSSILVTPVPIVTDVNPEQPLNAEAFIFSTVFGILMVLMAEHPEKAVEPISVSPSFNVTDVIPEHLANALLYIFTTVLGTTIDVSPEHPANADSSILVIPLSMVAAVK